MRSRAASRRTTSPAPVSSARRRSRRRRLRPSPGKVLPVPLDRLAQRSVETVLRRPPELAAGLAGVDPLLADFVLGLVEDLGLEIRCHQRPNPVDELEYRETRPPSEVERLPAQFRPLCKRLRKPRHTLGSVLDVEVVPNVTPVRADDRPLRPEQRANSAGNDSLPLEIASAVHVPASADRDAEAVAL